VFDDKGIYFDATAPSRLEDILQNQSFTDSDLDDARELINYLKQEKITKYNLGIVEAKLPAEAEGKRTILVPGQVDSDASITYGSPNIRNNRELIAEVKKLHPDAYLCYKPHPDLLAGARSDAPLWDGIENEVDHLILEGDIISWIQTVDEIHTLTSTVGFEALLHQKTVFTYGLPFYANWGLTQDSLTTERRTRKLTLDQLTAGVYLKYPTYLNPLTEEFTTALSTAKLLSSEKFIHDSRPTFLRIIGDLKSLYYRNFKNRTR